MHHEGTVLASAQSRTPDTRASGPAGPGEQALVGPALVAEHAELLVHDVVQQAHGGDALRGRLEEDVRDGRGGEHRHLKKHAASYYPLARVLPKLVQPNFYAQPELYSLKEGDCSLFVRRLA